MTAPPRRGTPTKAVEDEKEADCQSLADSQTTASAFTAMTIQTVDSLVPLERDHLVEGAMRNLGPLVKDVCLLLGQPELTSPALRSMGFGNGCKTVAHFTEEFFSIKQCSPSSQAILVTSVGSDTSGCEQGIRGLSKNPNAPTIIAVLVMPLSLTRSDEEQEEVVRQGGGVSTSQLIGLDRFNPSRSIALARSLSGARHRLFEAGADEVITLSEGEALAPHRIIEAIERSEFVARRHEMELRRQADSMQQDSARKLQVAFSRLMWSLPGSMLENIPLQDTELSERGLQSQNPGVGSYYFQDQLGQGANGQTYLAKHPQWGICAVKLIPKSTVKNVNALFSFDREVYIMQHIEKHPNVVQAFEVLHSKSAVYVSMEYAGKYNLHMYTKRVLNQTKARALPPNVVLSFANQMACAMAHIHRYLICHRDVKMTNWIISDDQQRVVLVDFGLAAQLATKTQRLTHSCGSLPFCAPEVFGMVEHPKWSYAPLPADCWSLGVNFAELALGPYSIEMLLEWKPRCPANNKLILESLLTLEQRWASVNPEDVGVLKPVIDALVVVDADRRPSIEEVLGPRFLNMTEELDRMMQPTKPTTSRSTHMMVASSGIGRRAVEGAAETGSLLDRLGSEAAVGEVMTRTLDHFLNAPGLGAVFESVPEQIDSLRVFMTEDLPKFFGCEPGSFAERPIRNRAVSIFARTIVTDTHISHLGKVMCNCFCSSGIQEDDAKEATRRFLTLRTELLQESVRAAANVKRMNTRAWRNRLLNSMPQRRVQAFAEQLASALSKSKMLKNSVVHGVTAGDIHELVVGYLSGEVAQCLPISEHLVSALTGPQYLVLVNVTRDSLVLSDWPSEVIEVLNLEMMMEWEALHAEKGTTKLFGMETAR